MGINFQFPVDLFTFTEEIFSGKFHFLGSTTSWTSSKALSWVYGSDEFECREFLITGINHKQERLMDIIHKHVHYVNSQSIIETLEKGVKYVQS